MKEPKPGRRTGTINGLPYDVPDGYTIVKDEYLERCADMTNLVIDLDRCVHGRHQEDACFGCPDGVSAGNPYRQQGDPLGHDISGNVIADPGRAKRNLAKDWVTPR